MGVRSRGGLRALYSLWAQGGACANGFGALEPRESNHRVKQGGNKMIQPSQAHPRALERALLSTARYS